MDTSMAMTRLEAAVEQQLLVAGGEPEVEGAARVLLAALEPALRQIAFDLAEQAAVEVAAQMPGHEIDVVVSEGEPELRVRRGDPGDVASPGESLDARITLRLPPTLKEMVEMAADQKGESINSWLVRTLSERTAERTRLRGGRIKGTIET